MIVSRRSLMLSVSALSAVAVSWILLSPRGQSGTAYHDDLPTPGQSPTFESEHSRPHQREGVRKSAAYRLLVIDDLGRPVAGATIKAYQPQAKWIPADTRSLGATDAAGELVIDACEAGNHLYARHPGFLTATASLPAAPAPDTEAQVTTMHLRRAVFQDFRFTLADGTPVADQLACVSRTGQDALLDEEPPGLIDSWPGVDAGAVYTGRSGTNGISSVALPRQVGWSFTVLPHDYLAVQSIEPRELSHVPGPAVEVTLAPLHGAVVCIHSPYVSYQAALDVTMGNAQQRQLQILARRIEKHAELQVGSSDKELRAWVGFAKPGKKPCVRLLVLWPSGETSEHTVPLQPLSEGRRPEVVAVAPPRTPSEPPERLSVAWSGIAIGPELVLRGPAHVRANLPWTRTLIPGREYAVPAGDYVIECRQKTDRDVMPSTRVTVGRELATVTLALPKDVGVCQLDAVLPSGVPASRVALRISQNGNELWVRHLQRAHGVYFLLRHGAYDVSVECKGCEVVRRSVQVGATAICRIEVVLPWAR